MKALIIAILALVIISIGAVCWMAAKKNTQPSISLISPNGGEVLKESSSFNIKWDTQNIPKENKISISMRRIGSSVQEGQEFDPIVFVNLENTGSKEWNISDMYPEGDYVLGITSYASLPMTDPISDESDSPFRIIKEEWQTYANKESGYSIDYPSSWTYREFPDTKTGAGFRPNSSSEDISSECISIDARGTAESEYNTSFEEYVIKAAIVEIQGFERLKSIEPFKTASGLIGYKTAWVYKDMKGQEKDSLPIAYFENKESPKIYKTIQVVLNGVECEQVYNQMLLTFK